MVSDSLLESQFVPFKKLQPNTYQTEGIMSGTVSSLSVFKT